MKTAISKLSGDYMHDYQSVAQRKTNFITFRTKTPDFSIILGWKKKTPLHRVVKDQAPDPATQWRE